MYTGTVRNSHARRSRVMLVDRSEKPSLTMATKKMMMEPQRLTKTVLRMSSRRLLK